MPSIESVARRIDREGLDMVLRRPGQVDMPFRGFLIGYASEEIGGDVYQGDRKIIMHNKEIIATGWPGFPERGDKVIIKRDNRLVNIENVETVSYRGRVAKHVLQVRG